MRSHARGVAAVLVGWILLLAGTATAATLTLQPKENTSEDVMAYEFLSTSNFNDYSFGPNNFGKALAAANTDGIGHDVKSLLRFDLSGTGLIYPGQIQSATLKLRVVDATAIGFPIANPSAANNATVDLRQTLGGWGETSVTWESYPNVGGSSLASATATGINQTLNFSSTGFTDLVRSWITSPASNFGISLDHREAKFVPASGKYVGVMFASSNFGSNEPLLEITLAPQKVGDANFDGWVDVADYTIWADNFLKSADFAHGDFSGDGFVDIADYTLWADNFEPNLGLAAVAVPEPATLALALAALPMLWPVCRRWRRR